MVCMLVILSNSGHKFLPVKQDYPQVPSFSACFKLLQLLSHATAASSNERSDWLVSVTNSRIIQKLKNSDYDGVPFVPLNMIFKKKISTSFLTETHQLKKKLRRCFPKKNGKVSFKLCPFSSKLTSDKIC